MRLLISGCSFTDALWPHLLGAHSVNNRAYPSSGNSYIANSIITSDLDDYDLVIVMWSGISRLDEIITNSDLFNDYPFKKDIGNSKCISSGGEAGSWGSHTFTRMLFESRYKLLSSEDLARISLNEMIRTQDHLTAHGVPYIFCSYINYWNQTLDWQSKNMDFGINNYPELTLLTNKIDFNHWVFLNDNKDGLFEIAEATNNLQEDKFHPNDAAGQIWSEIVKRKIKEINVIQ